MLKVHKLHFATRDAAIVSMGKKIIEALLVTATKLAESQQAGKATPTVVVSESLSLMVNALKARGCLWGCFLIGFVILCDDINSD